MSWVDRALVQAVGMLAITHRRRTWIGVGTTLRCVEESRDRERGAWERDEHAVKLAGVRVLEQLSVKRVVEQVVIVSAAGLAVVVDLNDVAPAVGSEVVWEAVGPMVRTREQAE